MNDIDDNIGPVGIGSKHSTGSVIGNLKKVGPAWRVIRKDKNLTQQYLTRLESLPTVASWETNTKRLLIEENHFAEAWCDDGSIVYELNHSIAAMFALTSAPDISWEHAPHRSFLIKVPRVLFPMENVTDSSDTWILASQARTLVVADYDTTASFMVSYADRVGSSILENPTCESQYKQQEILCHRFLSNTIAYVTAHRESVTAKGKYTSAGRSVFSVSQPDDVQIDRAFRDAAIAAVNSGDIIGVRRALAHVVRGHWRNQACGSGRSQRRLTWIHPHRRGEESLARVVSRIERIVK